MKELLTSEQAKKALKNFASKEKAKNLARFFKTGKGEYGEGDIFIGITVPESRSVAKRCTSLPLKEVEILICSKIHEERLLGLLILVIQFKNADDELRKKIFSLFIKNRKWINNWDLVDLSTPYIVGMSLLDSDRSLLFTYARSKNIWERRIAILATFAFIRIKDDFDTTFKIAEILLNDSHDLIHKAVGWMLREIGKKDQLKLEHFLKKHYKSMPRTMLRYAIERFPEKLRQKYLKGLVG